MTQLKCLLSTMVILEKTNYRCANIHRLNVFERGEIKFNAKKLPENHAAHLQLSYHSHKIHSTFGRHD